MNKKAFTLIELLTVIIILGMIMIIAVPNIVKVMDRNKRLSFVRDTERFIRAAEAKVLSDKTIELPKKPNDITVLNLNYIGSDEFINSEFGLPYSKYNSFIIIKKVSENYEYIAYLVACGNLKNKGEDFCLKDTKKTVISMQGETKEKLKDERKSSNRLKVNYKEVLSVIEKKEAIDKSYEIKTEKMNQFLNGNYNYKFYYEEQK